jgi:hypothetical protein
MDIKVSAEIKDAFAAFRKARSEFAVIVLRMNKASQEVEIDTEAAADNIKTFEDLAAALPESSPRFVLVSMKVDKGDGRVAYPLVFMFYAPKGRGNPQLNMMYTRAKTGLSSQLEVTHVIDVYDKENELNQQCIADRVRK